MKIVDRRNIILIVACIIISVVIFEGKVKAAGEMQILYTNQNANVYKNMDTGSEVIVELVAGTQVLSAGQDGEWMQIYYEGEKCYLLEECLSEDIIFEQELQQHEESNIQEIDHYIQVKEEEKREAFWEKLIITLVVVIFAGGIISAVSSARKEKDNEI